MCSGAKTETTGAQPTITTVETFSYDGLGHLVGGDETRSSGGAVFSHIVTASTFDGAGDSTSVSTITSTPAAATDGKTTGTTGRCKRRRHSRGG